MNTDVKECNTLKAVVAAASMSDEAGARELVRAAAAAAKSKHTRHVATNNNTKAIAIVDEPVDDNSGSNGKGRRRS